MNDTKQVEKRKNFLVGLPALIVGIISSLLILYGVFVQPRSLPGWYESQKTLAVTRFEEASSPSNSNRTVQSLLDAARFARIVFERSISLHHQSPVMRWEAANFDQTVVRRTSQWLETDRGFLTDEEREDLRTYNAEVRSSLKSALTTLASTANEYQSDALKLLARTALIDRDLPESNRLITLIQPIALDGKQRDVGLLALLTELQFATGQAADAKMSDNLAVLQRTDTPWTWDLRFRHALATNNSAPTIPTSSDIEDRVAAQEFFDRLSQLRLACCEGRWDEINRDTALFLADSTLAEQSYIRRELASFCGRLLQSTWASEHSDWCSSADRCQALALQLDASSSVATAAILDFINNPPAESTCVQTSFLQSKQYPLPQVLKCMYWAKRGGDRQFNSNFLEPDRHLTANIVLQVILSQLGAAPEFAADVERLATAISAEFPELGNAYYALAATQLNQKKFGVARENALRAKQLSGETAAIDYLIKELDRQQSASENLSQ